MKVNSKESFNNSKRKYRKESYRKYEIAERKMNMDGIIGRLAAISA